MNSAADVDELFQGWKAQGLTKEELIIRTAEAEIGWPYVWGAVAAQCTPAKRQYYAGRSSCPEAEAKLIISRCQALNGSGRSCGGCTYYPDNRRVLIDDCQGFIKQLASRVGISLTGGGCSTMWRNNANWEAKGTIDTLPEQLCCVFWQNQQDKTIMSHIGWYIGNGWMIHCSGSVKKEKLSKKCTHWAIPKGLDGDAPVPVTKPTLRRGSTGDYVIELQRDLLALGYAVGPSGADGIFGRNTETAVKAFQANHSLAADGICGPLTWAAIDAALEAGEVIQAPEKLFTVTVRHLTESRAREIVETFGGELSEE